jgi:hypothetical protein
MAVTLGDCKVLGRANKYVAAGIMKTLIEKFGKLITA